MGIRQTKQSLGFGPFINRHHFAGYMELTLGLPLGLLFSGAIERERRVLYILAAALMGIAIILTNSRGGMLSLVVEIMFLVMVSGVKVRRERRREGEEKSTVRQLAKRAALGFAIVLALFFGVLFFGGEGALNRLVGTVSADDPTTGRIHFWRGTLGIIRDHPLMGTGLGSFSLAYTRYDRSNGVLFRLEQAHNDYLQLLSDAGIIGAVLGLVFVLLLFRMALRRMESRNLFRRGVALGALAGCFAVLVHSFFDFTLHTTANALLFLMLAALATLNGRVEQPSRHRYRHAPSSAAPASASITTQPSADAPQLQ
jgi:O-antigen ligase